MNVAFGAGQALSGDMPNEWFDALAASSEQAALAKQQYDFNKRMKQKEVKWQPR